MSLLFFTIRDGGPARLFVWTSVSLAVCFLFEQDLFENFCRLL